MSRAAARRSFSKPKRSWSPRDAAASDSWKVLWVKRRKTEQIKHRRVHMICVRAPRGALPTTSVVAMPIGLMLAAHDQPDDVTWYVTPMEMGGPSFDDVPGDASGEVDPEIVSRGWMSLLALFPRLPEVDGL